MDHQTSIVAVVRIWIFSFGVFCVLGGVYYLLDDSVAFDNLMVSSRYVLYILVPMILTLTLARQDPQEGFQEAQSRGLRRLPPACLHAAREDYLSFRIFSIWCLVVKGFFSVNKTSAGFGYLWCYFVEYIPEVIGVALFVQIQLVEISRSILDRKKRKPVLYLVDLGCQCLHGVCGEIRTSNVSNGICSSNNFFSLFGFLVPFVISPCHLRKPIRFFIAVEFPRTIVLSSRWCHVHPIVLYTQPLSPGFLHIRFCSCIQDVSCSQVRTICHHFPVSSLLGACII
jgi:hypothetical protein